MGKLPKPSPNGKHFTHDPLLCGLDIDGLPLCRACRAEQRDDAGSDLAGMTLPDQEAFLRTLAPDWREMERKSLGLPEPLTDAERERVLRDLAAFPDDWRPVVLSILAGPIAEIVVAIMEVHRGRAA
jgi:hypothetical protein